MSNRETLQRCIINYQIDLSQTYRNCDVYRFNEYNSAVKIQSWFRGISTRCYLKYLEKCTIIIQKSWRGYLGRKYYRKLLNKAVDKSRWIKYNQYAAKIQSLWKGYVTRKYIFNYYARQIYLKNLLDIGKFVQNELIQYEKEMKQIEWEKEKLQIDESIKNWAKSHHFLKSTYSQPGIYHKINQKQIDYREQLLCCMKSELPKLRKSNTFSSKTIQNIKLSKNFTQPQGPFKKLDEVQIWCDRPLNLSLRVTTDYYSLDKARKQWKIENWIRQLHDNKFHAGHVSSPPYERLLMTTSSYGPIPYGTKHFRTSEEQSYEEIKTGKHQDKPRFRNILPPIPIFDRFNKEYIPGYVES